MKTGATADFPEIEWYELMHQLLEKDIDEREEAYECRGTGTDGKEYSGIATFTSNEFVKITDIYEQ